MTQIEKQVEAEQVEADTTADRPTEKQSTHNEVVGQSVAELVGSGFPLPL